MKVVFSYWFLLHTCVSHTPRIGFAEVALNGPVLVNRRVASYARKVCVAERPDNGAEKDHEDVSFSVVFCDVPSAAFRD
jgi:hypothetical protein